MFCRFCGAKMYLDDKDYSFKGKYDEYLNCPNCQSGCINQVRFGRPFKEIWHSENDNKVIDYVLLWNQH